VAKDRRPCPFLANASLRAARADGSSPRDRAARWLQPMARPAESRAHHAPLASLRRTTLLRSKDGELTADSKPGERSKSKRAALATPNEMHRARPERRARASAQRLRHRMDWHSERSELCRRGR